jgi:hypothetical protein
VLHGGTPVGAGASWSRFQDATDGPPFMVLSLKAGGTGLNLTAAAHVVHFDRWWNPAVENQATDRAYRIGQHKNVLVHKFVCRGTLEEKIDAMLRGKQGLADNILDRDSSQEDGERRLIPSWAPTRGPARRSLRPGGDGDRQAAAAVRARRDELRSRLLTRTWCARVGDCGAGGARLEHRLSRQRRLSLWGLDAQEPLASVGFVVPPLAADRRPLVEASRESQPGPLAITEPALEPEATAEPTHPEPSPSALASPASTPPNQQSEVRRDYLRVIGISARTIDAWLRSGVLRTTDRDGIYERTAEASRKIADFLAR